VVGERPKPFGPPLGWDPITSTLIYGEYDAVLVDPLTTVFEADALAQWLHITCSSHLKRSSDTRHERSSSTLGAGAGH
jgi:hypothetical protein